MATRNLTAEASPPGQLAHIVFCTNDCKRMSDWYCSVLVGHTTFDNGGGGAFITFDDEHHRVAMVQPREFPARPPQQTVGFYHVAFSYGTLEKLLNNYLRLRHLDIMPYRMMHHGLSISFYYYDPDQNIVELYVDSDPDDKAATTAWLSKPEFLRNPIGSHLDPDVFIADYLAGKPLQDLLHYPDA